MSSILVEPNIYGIIYKFLSIFVFYGTNLALSFIVIDIWKMALSRCAVDHDRVIGPGCRLCRSGDIENAGSGDESARVRQARCGAVTGAARASTARTASLGDLTAPPWSRTTGRGP
jgi:hypothetical protein